MPFYAYICETCASVCEKFHGMNEKPGECPSCGGIIQRLPSHVNISQASDVGKLVDEFIRQNKELTREEKEKLSKQEYKK